MSNALIHETSPYLLQHADNPVDWVPWSDSAFEEAKKEDKLIFLSVGYSTCHWCHVMAHESFENEEIAKILNHHFVCIKVDREELPDIDSAYMSFVQVSTGQGGWPMSVWLTPEGNPVFGGTYYPPEDRQGRPGFPRVCHELARVWRDDKEKVMEGGKRAIQHLRQQSTKESPLRGLPSIKVFGDYIDACESLFDPSLGGFGGAPKFPRPVVVRTLMQLATRYGIDSTEGQSAWDMSERTLKAMAAGGIHDQLGGGFHRYSVDRYWHTPHYEKMLYDQAQIAMAYLDAWEISKDQHYRDVVVRLFDYMLNTLRDSQGPIHAAEDADSFPDENSKHTREGAFWTWSAEEIGKLLDPRSAAIFCQAYGIQVDGNSRPESDPHGELKGQNTLYVAVNLNDLATAFDCPVSDISDSLAASSKILVKYRDGRPKPHRDDKLLTAWNGLAIGALARGGRLLKEKDYTKSAGEIAKFFKKNLWDGDRLYRSFRKHRSDTPGYPSDYAFLISGLIELHRTSPDHGWLQFAHELQIGFDRDFWDPSQAGYVMTPKVLGRELVSIREEYDGAEPASNHVAAENLIHLSKLLDESSYLLRAESLIRAGSRLLETQTFSCPVLLAAYDLLDRKDGSPSTNNGRHDDA